MSLIQIEHLSFTYPGSYDPVFEDVNLRLDSDWKLGFIGKNGKGKTTLLRLLMGEYPYQGKITSQLSFDYFPYAIADEDAPVREVLLSLSGAESWRLMKEFGKLKLAEELLYRPFRTLSGGEQTKVLLAAMFAGEDRFLLIDEPTNHLDLIGRRQVAEYLSGKTGFILVSHDRHFLNSCIDHVLSLNKTSIQLISGNYDTWRDSFLKNQAFELRQNERLEKDIARLEKAAKQTAQWSDKVEATKIGFGPTDRGAIGHKAARMMQRSKAIEERNLRAAEEKKKLLWDVETEESLKMHPIPYEKKVLVRMDKLVLAYDGKKLSQPISLTLAKGERVFFTGGNGSGKSSVLRKIAEGSFRPLQAGSGVMPSSKAHGALALPEIAEGSLRVGSGLKISYVPQDTSFLKGGIMDFIHDMGADRTLFLTNLRKLGFDRVQFEKPMEELSSGQKKKILLALSLSVEAHLYIWDEPLNYIDIYSRLQLEELIKAYEPTMLLVEHDEAFISAVGTTVVELSPVHAREN